MPPKIAKSREIPTKFDFIAVQGHPRLSTLFDAPLGENPLEFMNETYPAKTGGNPRGMVLPCGKNFNRCRLIHPCDTDRRTDRRWIARYSLSIYAIRSRALKNMMSRSAASNITLLGRRVQQIEKSTICCCA